MGNLCPYQGFLRTLWEYRLVIFIRKTRTLVILVITTIKMHTRCTLLHANFLNKGHIENYVPHHINSKLLDCLEKGFT